jgi:hypothetical protein
MNCKRCDTKMVKGTAIKHVYTGDRGHCKFPNTENAKMVKVAKCPECGYSVK